MRARSVQVLLCLRRRIVCRLTSHAVGEIPHHGQQRGPSGRSVGWHQETLVVLRAKNPAGIKEAAPGLVSRFANKTTNDSGER